jgi:osmotically-inducible protein OsmY
MDHLRPCARLNAIAVVLAIAVSACAGKTISATLDDATITARVKTVLLNDPQVGATKIDVTTSGGVVTMSGAVKSRADETRAIGLARQVNGVRDVHSNLQVTGG